MRGDIRSAPPNDMRELPPARDVARIVLVVLFIGLMIVSSLWILQPFLGALIWATMIVVATWPLMLNVQNALGGRRWAAVIVMTLAMLFLLVAPLTIAILTVIDRRDEIVNMVASLSTMNVPPPPAWLEGLPLVGTRISEEWRRLAAIGSEELAKQAAPYIRQALTWFAGQAGSLGLMVLHFLLTLIIAAILYANGEVAAHGVRRFGRRLADERGENAVVLSGQAIRAVALGVIVTAVVQSAAAGLGLAVAGIPYAAVLTTIIFVLCIAQIGPILILVPAVAWVYWSGETLWGTLLLIYSIAVALLDNVLRPILIRRGADLPLLLIFAGVIGGLVSFGVIGLFVGPTVLAVTYRLLETWIADIDHKDAEVERVSAFSVEAGE
jgi:predicted PurR-regulated permease PerM